MARRKPKIPRGLPRVMSLAERDDLTPAEQWRAILAVITQQADEGYILDDGRGNLWILKGGKWVSMAAKKKAAKKKGTKDGNEKANP